MSAMKVIYKGGQDVDGNWNDTKTFTRENHYVLENVTIPLFMAMGYVPRRNSIHPVYPWCVAEDSRIRNNIELTGKKDGLGGRGITVSTTYRYLKLLEGHDGEEQQDPFIAKNFPWLLPAQDYKIWPIKLEESQNCLYRFGKWDKNDMHDNLNYAGENDNNWKNESRADRTVERCRNRNSFVHRVRPKRPTRIPYSFTTLSRTFGEKRTIGNPSPVLRYF